jgi:hypothetical protein
MALARGHGLAADIKAGNLLHLLSMTRRHFPLLELLLQRVERSTMGREEVMDTVTRRISTQVLLLKLLKCHHPLAPALCDKT